MSTRPFQPEQRVIVRNRSGMDNNWQGEKGTVIETTKPRYVRVQVDGDHSPFTHLFPSGKSRTALNLAASPARHSGEKNHEHPANLCPRTSDTFRLR